MAATLTPSPAASAAESTDRGSGRHGVSFAVVCLSLALVVAWVAMLNVALPTMTRALGASQQWMIDGYTVALAALLLFAGALGERPAAALVGAHKVYELGAVSVQALDGVDVAFGTGQLTAVMGPSGSGKSTLLHCSAGLDHLSAGSAWIGDVELGTRSNRDLTLLRRRGGDAS
jgi:ABC-type uncharacterized transport system fused permease/ATPase subunit